MALSLNQEKTHVPYFFLKNANIRICSEAESPRAVAAGQASGDRAAGQGRREMLSQLASLGALGCARLREDPGRCLGPAVTERRTAGLSAGEAVRRSGSPGRSGSVFCSTRRVGL